MTVRHAVWLRVFVSSFLVTLGAVGLFAYAIELPLSQGFMPHGHCYLWRPGILAVHVAAQVGYAAAYGLIFILLRSMVRALPDAFPSVTVVNLFATFILVCGITHTLRVVVVWRPIYYLAAFVDSVGAAVSLVTVAFLYFRGRPAFEAYLARNGQRNG